MALPHADGPTAPQTMTVSRAVTLLSEQLTWFTLMLHTWLQQVSSAASTVSMQGAIEQAGCEVATESSHQVAAASAATTRGPAAGPAAGRGLVGAQCGSSTAGSSGRALDMHACFREQLTSPVTPSSSVTAMAFLELHAGAAAPHLPASMHQKGWSQLMGVNVQVPTSQHELRKWLLLRDGCTALCASSFLAHNSVQPGMEQQQFCTVLTSLAEDSIQDFTTTLPSGQSKLPAQGERGVRFCGRLLRTLAWMVTRGILPLDQDLVAPLLSFISAAVQGLQQGALPEQLTREALAAAVHYLVGCMNVYLDVAEDGDSGDLDTFTSCLLLPENLSVLQQLATSGLDPTTPTSPLIGSRYPSLTTSAWFLLASSVNGEGTSSHVIAQLPVLCAQLAAHLTHLLAARNTPPAASAAAAASTPGAALVFTGSALATELAAGTAAAWTLLGTCAEQGVQLGPEVKELLQATVAMQEQLLHSALKGSRQQRAVWGSALMDWEVLPLVSWAAAALLEESPGSMQEVQDLIGRSCYLSMPLVAGVLLQQAHRAGEAEACETALTVALLCMIHISRSADSLLHTVKASAQQGGSDTATAAQWIVQLACWVPRMPLVVQAVGELLGPGQDATRLVMRDEEPARASWAMLLLLMPMWLPAGVSAVAAVMQGSAPPSDAPAPDLRFFFLLPSPAASASSAATAETSRQGSSGAGDGGAAAVQEVAASQQGATQAAVASPADKNELAKALGIVNWALECMATQEGGSGDATSDPAQACTSLHFLEAQLQGLASELGGVRAQPVPASSYHALARHL
eukprot:CAMPEP_0202876058 /NCGR_PEP_ID=MMETSP1391-20130828/28416_1 /ASSEMBLY_ACC=CAM_ASM_000867 /TAXON_ID=1034604 /ORGANISM="Chlamydomonas leiostraca, Strain SAG 11-49" /LENGTH=800 /DNA_ID=CAMNT_0049557837 /DNA_START=20 /DNA_END=2419 /DNA_ORIENTATION=-